MVNFSHALLQPFREQNPDYSILDLKSHYRGYKYASETIKMLPQISDAILHRSDVPMELVDIFQQIACMGASHSVLHPAEST